MSTHPEKKDTNIPISMPSSMKSIIVGYAEAADITASEMGYAILLEWIESKKSEANLLNKLLGIKVLSE